MSHQLHDIPPTHKNIMVIDVKHLNVCTIYKCWSMLTTIGVRWSQDLGKECDIAKLVNLCVRLVIFVVIVGHVIAMNIITMIVVVVQMYVECDLSSRHSY